MGKIELKNIGKAYEDGKYAVKDINLTIEEGEFIVFVGPSGCGKSTTLRMIAGLEEITAGDLYIDGKRENDTKAQNRDLAMVFQSYALYPHKTVYQNLAYPLKIRKISKSEIDNKVRKIASLIEIEDLLDRKPNQLSGGQRQRVALGRCIIRSPKAFLMDEPLSNLDAKLRVSMRTEIVNIQKELKSTFIYVTHDQVEAMTMGDRIVVMNSGKIQQIGTPTEIYERPTNLFVASFIGSPAMNFIDINLFNKDNILTNYFKDFAVNSNLLVGIRPEAILASRKTEEDIEFTTVVESVETLGAENYVKLNLYGEKLTMRDFSLSKYSEGQSYSFYINPHAIYIFDKKTGSRISYKK